MSNVKLSCEFCGSTNTKRNRRGIEEISNERTFLRCKNCGTVLCYSCHREVNKGTRCSKCGAKKSMVKIHNGSDCFITTATINKLGKPDDCYELNMFRDYRDSYLQAANPELITEYYHVAPDIVKNIDKQNNNRSIYHEIWDNYLRECLSLIEKNENEQAKSLYQKMVIDLKNKYL